MTDHPRDDLLRASYPAVELRAADEASMPTMVGHFARFNEWTRIESTFEGTFMERIAPGAFSRTIKNNLDRVRVLFQHGRDPQIGDKPLGPIEAIREDDDGAWYEVPLLDTSYNRDLLPGLRAGLYGASFRFSIPDGKDDWNMKPAKSPHNPDGLPERTIREARLMEFGPVTFPAYAGATAGVRSLTFTDLDAAFEPPVEEAAALPDAGPEPEAHSDEGTREAVHFVEPEQEDRHVADISQYRSREEMANRLSELDSAIGTLAVAYPGVLPTEEQARWDDMTGEQDDLRAAIAAWDERQARIAGMARKPENTSPAYVAPAFIRKPEDIYDVAAVYSSARSEEEYGARLRDNAMRAVDVASFTPGADRARAQEGLADLIDHKDTADHQLARRVLSTDSPLYKRAFNKILTGQPLSPEEQRGTALAVGVDGTGGYAVPVSFDPTVIPIGAWTYVNPFRAVCRIEQIVGTDTWQALTSTAVTATRTTEAAAATEQGPTFARPEVIVKRVHATVTYSHEMGQDRPDLASELARLFAEAKDTEEESEFATGDGSTVHPIGVFAAHGTSGMYTHVDTAASNTLAIGDLYNVEAGLPIRHRPNAVWMMGRKTLRDIQALETTGGQLFGGQYYNSVSYPGNAASGNTGLRLLNYPVFEVPSAPTALTDNYMIAWLGDPKSFVIVDRVGMSIELIPNMLDATTGLPTGQRGVYAIWRNSAKPLNTDGGRLLAVLA